MMHVPGVTAGAGLIGLPSRAGFRWISALMMCTHVNGSACELVHGGLLILRVWWQGAGYHEGVRREHLTRVWDTRCC